MLSERPAPTLPATPASEPPDRCRFGPEFDRGTVDCPAFQRAQFIAATSYGKPLGIHAACAHLLVGELTTNQFYARCSLGSDLEKMRWVAMMGVGRIEVLRALNAEFEALYAESLRQLVSAKAAALADPPDDRSVRHELAALVRAFAAQLAAFIDTNADRIAEIGISTTELSARVAQALREWQYGARLDLPGLDEESLVRLEGLTPKAHLNIGRASGLLISAASQPASLILAGSVDSEDLDAIDVALNGAMASGEHVTIDLSAVVFCSIAGLRTLIRAAETGRVTLNGMQPQLRRALLAAGLAGAATAGPPSADLEVAG